MTWSGRNKGCFIEYIFGASLPVTTVTSSTVDLALQYRLAENEGDQSETEKWIRSIHLRSVKIVV